MSLKSLMFSVDEPKGQVFKKIRAELRGMGFNITEEDLARPWGGFFRISNQDITKFITEFFPGQKFAKIDNLGPKILIFSPNRRISWQVHSRRGEFWKIVIGPVGIYLNPVDDLPENFQTLSEGETTYIEPGIRHRNGAVNNWGVIAEIWVHTDPQNPSDENDIRRIADDYGR